MTWVTFSTESCFIAEEDEGGGSFFFKVLTHLTLILQDHLMSMSRTLEIHTFCLGREC